MKVKLTLAEILNLNIELSGLNNPETGEIILNGLLSQELSLVTKFKLSELSDEISPIVSNIDKLRDGLIKKRGTEKDGLISIEKFIGDNKLNPVFLEFQDEYNKLLSKEKEIEVFEFSIEEFNIKTSDRYDFFFKLLKTIKNK